MEVDAEGQDPDQPDGAPEPAAAGAGGPPPPEAGGTGNGANDRGWSADGIEPQLRRFVTWLVPTLELWEKIPACWAAHPGVVEELRVAHQLYQAALAVTDPAAAGRVRADWQDYLGRVLDRLAASPGGGCAQRGEHRTGRTWDRQDSALQTAGRPPKHPHPTLLAPGCCGWAGRGIDAGVLSIGRIGAGDGYRYLTDQVATQDAPRAGENLHAYYQRSGYPPGIWVGAQANAFGLTGPVEVEPMGRLFGRCAHPVTGDTLGRHPADFRTLSERVTDRIALLDHPPTDIERAAIAADEAASPNPQPVAGFDLTFSAPKSVSVLWALGGEEVRDALRAAHQTAWREAFAMFETEVAATRLGTGGIAQVDVAGVTAAAFEHWYSRAGDPQLHTHVAVSAMVATADGRWRRLDSRALYRAAAVLSERYRAALVTTTAASLGLTWEHRPSSRSDTLLPEIAGIPDDLLRLFSTRQLQVETTLADLADQYTQKHGRSPDRAALSPAGPTSHLG